MLKQTNCSNTENKTNQHALWPYTPIPLQSPCQGETEQKKAKEKKTQNVNQKKIHSNKRSTVDDWHKRYIQHLSRLSHQDRAILKPYLFPIFKGINKATVRDGLGEFERFDEVKESFGYELIIQNSDYILAKRPPENKIIRWAYRLTSIRKPSWGNSLIRQWETMAIHSAQYKRIEYRDEETDMIATDVTLANSEWLPPIDPPNPFNNNPEEMILEFEALHKVQQLPDAVGSIPKKHAAEYQGILEAQLGAIDVKSEHGVMFGIQDDDVKDIKHQAIEAAREIVAEGDEETAEKQQLYKAQKGKKWKANKSTFKQRKALHRYPYAEEHEPKLIRLWRVVDGQKGKSSGSTISKPNDRWVDVTYDAEAA
jgi:hypothetical protein